MLLKYIKEKRGLLMCILRYIFIFIMGINIIFAINGNNNPKKTASGGSFKLNPKKIIEKPVRVIPQKEFKSNHQLRPQVETNPYIDPRDAEFDALDHPEITAPLVALIILAPLIN